MEISNFYTATVYEKGAEVVRMIHTLVGSGGFRRGMDLYFRRHDGQAVTTDDFVAAMADANGADLAQFKRWYDQAGTPTLDVTADHDAAAGRYTLTVRQSVPPTPGQPEKLPMHIPLALGLVGPDGREFPLRLEGEPVAAGTDRVLQLRSAEERFVLVDVPQRPVPSLLRRFSAPVNLRFECAEADLVHLMAHDSDEVNRWEAGQRLALAIVLRGVDAIRSGRGVDVPRAYVDAVGRLLADGARDPAFTAEALVLPSEPYVAEQFEVVDPDAIHAARNVLRRAVAQALGAELRTAYRSFEVTGPYSPDAQSAGCRALRNMALGYLMELGDPEIEALCTAQFDRANNMTDRMAALGALANSDAGAREGALERFYDEWKHEPLVVDKWLSVQATSRRADTLARTKALLAHEAFDIRNPNKVYALIRSFCANHVRFHAADGGGYAFAAERVMALDPLNPQIALERIGGAPNLSRDVREVVTKALS
jgi:aminopeptidase N